MYYVFEVVNKKSVGYSKLKKGSKEFFSTSLGLVK